MKRSARDLAVLWLGTLLCQLAHGQQAFNWGQYLASDIDQVIQRDAQGDFSGARGAKFWLGPRKLSLQVTLEAYPHACDTHFLKRAFRMISIPDADLPPINHCILFKSGAGQIYSAYIQDEVGEFLPKEVKLHKPVTIFVAYVYLAHGKRPGLVVNEFTVPAPETSKQRQQSKAASAK